MSDLSNQRRMAADILKCGEGRVWLDPASEEQLTEAVTRADIRKAVKSGAIRRQAIQGTSRARAKQHAREVAKGRHQGPGSRRGTPASRIPRKERWIRRIRAQREELAALRDSKKITPSVYREFYRRAKGGMFRSRAHLKMNLKLAGHLTEES